MSLIEQWSAWWTALAILAAAALAIFARGRKTWRKVNRVLDVILGTPERVDPLSGVVLETAVPDIGTRTARIEKVLSDVVVSSVDQAKAAATASAQAAEAAKVAAEAARSLAEAAHERSERTAEELAALRDRVDHWQRGDRRAADAASHVLHEIGLDADLPTPREEGRR